MGDEGAGEPFMGVVAGGAGDYEGVLPSDTISLSDSDSDDFGFTGDAEDDTACPEESLPLDDTGGRSDESGDPLHGNRKSPVQPFHLKGMSSTFTQRSQSIFDCLEGAAKRAVPSIAEDNVIDGSFKRPLPPPTILNKMPAENLGRPSKPPTARKSSPAVPDYITHPERWTKYNLDDISESSDKTNRSVAMEFLKGLEKSREEKSSTKPESYTLSFNQDPSSSGAGRIIFTKPTKASLDRKRPCAKEDEETELTDANQEAKESPPKKSKTQNEEEGILDPLKEVEGWKQLKLEALDVQRGSDIDSSEKDEETVVETMGFRGSKKRNRKHFRLKASP
ncbi:U5 small nuclear ribonucleoprotein TSSC4 [Rhineura floridana]|uniref:U5 small nuclear ribonucleoprotein TSSC4 n=1 Tax=Rhineura floridana TaxID=261503 RepID=UPI002AC881CF|nr:U5 small nuclear ribonucleoprotein TSSC4 [Rhineura floridana]XP_061466145.1 U5 small nuclear ribonucleoprotein TSSC4 [Rhineura floridana]